MNKSRVPVKQMTVNTAHYDFRKIKIYFYKVNKSLMNIYGNYEYVMRVLAKKLNIYYNEDTEILIPVHELQKDVVVDNFFNNLPLQEVGFSNAVSQCSVRTVKIDGIDDYTFKLSLGMVINSFSQSCELKSL